MSAFCEKIQTITDAAFCGTNPQTPIGNFPNDYMTCVFQVPSEFVPSGLTEQYIFVGKGYGLTYEQSLKPNNVCSVLNVAYDVNDPTDLQQQDNGAYKDLPIQDKGKHLNLPSNCDFFLSQLSKVGLIDGSENEMNTLIAAVYMADQLLEFKTPGIQIKDKMTNIYKQGNLFIHCHDGGSRSVTIAALFIYYKFYANNGTKTFEEVYKSIICYRWSEAHNHHPSKGICNTAYEILSTYAQLFPKPVYK